MLMLPRAPLVAALRMQQALALFSLWIKSLWNDTKLILILNALRQVYYNKTMLKLVSQIKPLYKPATRLAKTSLGWFLLAGIFPNHWQNVITTCKPQTFHFVSLCFFLFVFLRNDAVITFSSELKAEIEYLSPEFISMLFNNALSLSFLNQWLWP